MQKFASLLDVTAISQITDIERRRVMFVAQQHILWIGTFTVWIRVGLYTGILAMV